jgi:hypothetical protein
VATAGIMHQWNVSLETIKENGYPRNVAQHIMRLSMMLLLTFAIIIIGEVTAITTTWLQQMLKSRKNLTNGTKILNHFSIFNINFQSGNPINPHYGILAAFCEISLLVVINRHKHQHILDRTVTIIRERIIN